MYAILWRFEVDAAHCAEFEATYGPEGDWARLFARSEGFRGTELLRGEDGSYVTLDIWRDEAAFDAFRAAHCEDYEALDRRTEGWILCEHRLGDYEVLDQPAQDASAAAGVETQFSPSKLKRA